MSYLGHVRKPSAQQKCEKRAQEVKTAGKTKALCFINHTILCLNSIVLLRRWVGTCTLVCKMWSPKSRQCGRSGAKASRPVTSSSSQSHGDYHVLGLVHIPKTHTRTHTCTHHPPPLAVSWHREAMRNPVQIHLGGGGHVKIQSSPSCVAGQVPPGSATGPRDAEASYSCWGPFRSFIPPIFSLSLPNL